MSFILGMDTGGTYTDGVIIEMSSRRILCKAKALTTKSNLAEGIKNCIGNLNFDKLDEISQVSLSTTLATNAIVERRGARVGLIYMGTELDESVPADIALRVKGRFDIMGRQEEDIDCDELREVFDKMKGKVEALAVSGYASVRNPKHEQQISRLAADVLGVPVVCAHQLTSALGFHHRTVTAVLNGKLIPIITELIRSMNDVLDEKHISAPMMIVRGDGSLMTSETAKERPIETILSGPAASVIGSLALTGRKEGIVVDMGGTTTDIANIADGTVKMRREGAKVGGWFTRVKAVEMSTFGLGGDSCIFLDKKGNMCLGSQKVWPLCVVGAKYPYLEHELKSFRRVGEYKSYFEQEADCYIFMGEKFSQNVSEKERKILDILKERPHSLTYLAGALGVDAETIDMTGLVKSGTVARASVTPTDILHVKGKYDRWNRNMSWAGIEILARRKGITVSKFADMAEQAVNEKLAVCCLQSMADFEGEALSLAESPEAMYLMQSAFHNKGKALLKPSFAIGKPVIAIGAPAGAWVSRIGELLDIEILVPEHADVANAYGAAAGQITETAELLIIRDGEQYILNTPWERFVYATKEEAMFYAIHEGRKYIEHSLGRAGCRSWKIEEAFSDIFIDTVDPGQKEGISEVCAGTKLYLSGKGSFL